MLPGFLHTFAKTQISEEVQQVTALIIRCVSGPYSKQYELLYLQRAYSQKDLYSGDICFPGGHRQNNQNPLQTAIRQTKQETALQLTPQHYVGPVNYLFSTMRTPKQRQHKYLMTALVFYIGEDKTICEGIKVNEEEIRDYRWINLNRLVDGNTNDFCYWFYSGYSQDRLNDRTRLECPGYKIGMDRPLWGLTLIVTHKFLLQYARNPVNKLIQGTSLQFIEQLLKHSLSYHFSSPNKGEGQQIVDYMRDRWAWGNINLVPKF